MNILFSHHVKTGGTSVVDMLRLKFPETPHNHNILPTYLQIKKQKIDFSFATVRNPYDEFLDKYNYFDVINNKFKNINLFLDAIEKDGFRISGVPFLYLIPQHHYVINETYSVDDLIKIESFDVDCKRIINDKLGIDTDILHSNKTKNIKFKKLTNSQKERVYNIYEKDFSLLGYKK